MFQSKLWLVFLVNVIFITLLAFSFSASCSTKLINNKKEKNCVGIIFKKIRYSDKLIKLYTRNKLIKHFVNM